MVNGMGNLGGIDADGEGGELGGLLAALGLGEKIEEQGAVLVGDGEDGVETAQHVPFVAAEGAGLALKDQPAQPANLGRHALGKLVDGVVRVQQGPGATRRGLDGEQGIPGHAELVGVDQVEAGLLRQATQQRAHLRRIVAGDDHGQPGGQPFDPGAEVAGCGADHGHGMDGAAILRQVRHVFGPVVGAHEGDQGDIVALAKMAQHVVGAHLGAGVQRIGEDLGEEEDVQWLIGEGEWGMVNW
ncbi:MAG: hypothetical protein V9H69_07390 [Anaerolineae bacterium]